MADVVPDGPASLQFPGCAKLLAASSALRVILTPEDAGATLSETEVLDYIDYPFSERDHLSKHPHVPLVVISSDSMDEWVMTNQFHSYGTLLISFMFPIPEEYLFEPKNAEMYFRNQLSAIFLELFNKANTPAEDGTVYWNLVQLDQVIAPGPCDRKKLPEGIAPFYSAEYQARYV